MVPNFKSAAADYVSRWHNMEVTSAVKKYADTVGKVILDHRSLYDTVEKELHVPWYWLGPIHYREADLSFKCHLANGDSLEHDTVHVPRRLMGCDGPFGWPDAAIAALKKDHDQSGIDWSTLGRFAYQMEAYNGWGYRAHDVTSPYLWSQSNQHLKGKYVSDGVYSAHAVDEQLGGLVILKSLMEMDSDINFSDL